MALTPYFIEAGGGSGVVCIHSNASVSAQWRSLMDRIFRDFHILAPDSLGAGKSPAWPGKQTASLSDEVELLRPVFKLAGSPFSIVGHSYGGAVALMSALAHRKDVRSLVLFEPTLFALLEQDNPGQDAFNEAHQIASDASDEIEAGNPNTAAALFINYWMGEGSWGAMPESTQAVIAGSMSNIKAWAYALFSEPTPLDDFRTLDIPVLCLVGDKSPPSSLAVSRLLAEVLPQGRLVEVPGVGHMGPVTHPEIVNEAIAKFLEQN
jgi:pimeloyl-ACP methyl ester carboxylesterase